MVQVTFDTNSDSIEELHEALKILQQAIERRSGKAPVHAPAPKPAKMDIAHPVEEETAIDTPFFKITVKEAEEAEAKPEVKVPTLNQLIEDESLSEDELGKLFKEQIHREEEEHAHKAHKEKPKEKQKEDAYIEIIEYADDKQA